MIQVDKELTATLALASPLPLSSEAPLSGYVSGGWAQSDVDDTTSLKQFKFGFQVPSQGQFTVLQGRQGALSEIRFGDGGQRPRSGSVSKTLHLVPKPPNVYPATPAKQTRRRVAGEMNKFLLKIAQKQLHKRMREVVELKAGAKVMSQVYPFKSLAIIDCCESYYRAAVESDQLYDYLIHAPSKQDTTFHEDMLARSNEQLIDVLRQLERLKGLADC